jgi:replicative DNA helicase
VTAPLDAALRYLGRGWSPIDVPDGAKAPGRNGWQRERLTADDLRERFGHGPRNVGMLLGEPSGWLVDVDLDCPEALRLAPAFLPKTGAMFGRTSTPEAHRLYVANGARTTRLDDPAAVRNGERARLVELLSTRTHALAPPSVHPSGEPVTWQQEDDPAQVEEGDLLARVRALAAASLLARYWPRGARHGAAGALAGGLLRAGWPVERVAAFLGAVADAADDEEPADRLRFVTDTAANLAAGKLATGWPTLATVLGGPVVDRVRDWLDVAGDDPPEWEPPTPLGAVLDLPPFPVDALPDWLAAYVAALAEATQTPPDLAGMLALAALATASGGRVEVAPRSGWWEPTNLFAAIAMEPGSRKSAVFRGVMAPLVTVERELLAAARPLIVEAEARKRIADAVAKTAEQKAATAKAFGKPDAAALAEIALEATATAALVAVPVAPRLIADDATPEALATLMAEQGGPIALLSPEGGVFDLMAGRYREGSGPNLDPYLKGHAGDELRVDRKGRPPEYVEHPALTVGLAVQPTVLQGLADRPGFRGRGLLARFLFALPASTVGRRDVDAAPVAAQVADTYSANLPALARTLRQRQTPLVLALDPAAQQRLRAFMHDLEPRLWPDGGDLGHLADWGAKLAGALVRIAGLLEAATTPAGPWEAPIGAPTMAAALRFGDYLTAHALAAFDAMGADPELADARYLLAHLDRNRVERFTVRDLFSDLPRGRFGKVADLTAPLALLADHGYVRELEPPERKGPGRRPSPTFLVNPLAGSI